MNSIRYVTASQAARSLGVSVPTITRWMRAGRFPHARVVEFENLTVYQIPADEVEAVRAERGRHEEDEEGGGAAA